MRVAFTLFHYFPYGGLERDMLSIARACKARNHEVVIYTQSWQAELPNDLPIVVVPARGFTNHGRAQVFARRFAQLIAQEKVDLVVGFNKMPGLDVYFAADTCFAQKVYEERSWFYRLSSRSRSYLDLESAVFGTASKCHILMISQAQIPIFHRYYLTPMSRLHLLPPGINRGRIMPEDYVQKRKLLRQNYAIDDAEVLMLMVGSDFRRKGVARAIRALANLPVELRIRTRLWVAGKGNARPFINLARKYGVDQQLSMLGTRDDISELMWAADVFLHPAYSENTGTVLLESMVAGLPVIASNVCGYAQYIESWQMGKVLSDTQLDDQLAGAVAAIVSQDASVWRARAQQFIDGGEVFSMIDKAVAIIEALGRDEPNL